MLADKPTFECSTLKMYGPQNQYITIEHGYSSGFPTSRCHDTGKVAPYLMWNPTESSTRFNLRYFNSTNANELGHCELQISDYNEVLGYGGQSQLGTIMAWS